MGKPALIYATKTGHSRKIATAIGKALGAEALDISANPVLEEVGLLFIVGGIYGGRSLPALLKYVGTLEAKKVKGVALITSCLSKKQGQEGPRKILQEKGIAVRGEFICQGSFLFLGLGHPNGKEIQEAVDFAVRLAKDTQLGCRQ